MTRKWAYDLAMTQTTAAPLIGRCVACKRTFRVASEIQARITSCDCRQGIECSDWAHQHGQTGGVPTPDHPVTAIRWRTVKATVTDKDCDSRCQHARSGKCACSCGGQNHGAAFTVAFTHNTARRAQPAPAEPDADEPLALF
jgi:hypothetical protein